jgi:hypothetical protein
VTRIFTSQSVRWTIVLFLTVVVTVMERPAFSVEPMEPTKKSTRKKGHRLPHHYAKVVKPEQREQIYKIQEKYQPKLEDLEAQIKGIKKQRDEEISAVLTPEQRKKVEEASGKGEKQAAPAEKSPPAKK